MNDRRALIDAMMDLREESGAYREAATNFCAALAEIAEGDEPNARRIARQALKGYNYMGQTYPVDE